MADDTYTSAILFGTELRSDVSSSKPYTVFQVMVSRGQDQWVVQRTHALFAALYARLKDRFSYAVKRQNLRMPKGKKLRSAPSPMAISRVHRKLQRFLIGIFAEPQLRTSHELDQFLSVGRQPLNEYMHVVQPFIDTICQLGELGEAPEPKTSPRGQVFSYAANKGMQGVAEGGLIGLDVRLSGYLSMNQKGHEWRERFFQLRGANALFKFASAKDSVPIKVYDLQGCKLTLVPQGEREAEGAKASNHCFKLTWTKQKNLEEPPKRVSIVFATRTADDLGAWVSHLNNFAMARADALVRKRIPEIALLTGKGLDDDAAASEDTTTELESPRRGLGSIMRRKSNLAEGKGKECKGDKVRRPRAMTIDVPAVTVIDPADPLAHKTIADGRDAYRVLKRSGSDFGAKVAAPALSAKPDGDAAEQTTQAGSGTKPAARFNPATISGGSKRRHKRSSSMIDRKSLLMPNNKAAVIKLSEKSDASAENAVTAPAAPQEATQAEADDASSAVQQNRMGSVREAMARSKRSIGLLLQTRPSVFSSHPNLPVTPPEQPSAATTRLRSASHVVRLRPKAEAGRQENGASLAFVHHLLDGLAEDEAQVDLAGLQAEVKKFAPGSTAGMAPLCGHAHQLSFVALHAIQDVEARRKVADALLESLPQANRAAMLRLLAFLERTAVRLGAERARAQREAAEKRRAEDEAQRAAILQKKAAREAANSGKKTDMYRVLKRRQTAPDDRRRTNIFPQSPAPAEPTTPTTPKTMMEDLAYSSPSSSFSTLTLSLSSSCSCVSVASLGDDEAPVTATAPAAEGCAGGAMCCYSARIERELAEERERIHRRAEAMKHKADEMARMQKEMDTEVKTKKENNVEDDKKDEEEAAVRYVREKLAATFGRVIMAADQRTARHLQADPRAVASVAAFLIEYCGGRTHRQHRTEDDVAAIKADGVDAKVVDDANTNDDQTLKEAEDEQQQQQRQRRRAEAQNETAAKENEERRERKKAMIARARERKGLRLEELRRLRLEAESKAGEDRRSRTVA